MAQLVKNPPAMWETWVQSLRWGDPLQKGKATHFSFLENFMDYAVHGVTKSQTRLKELSTHTQRSCPLKDEKVIIFIWVPYNPFFCLFSLNKWGQHDWEVNRSSWMVVVLRIITFLTPRPIPFYPDHMDHSLV